MLYLIRSNVILSIQLKKERDNTVMFINNHFLNSKWTGNCLMIFYLISCLRWLDVRSSCEMLF